MDANTPRLDEILASALARPPVRDWLLPDDERSLADCAEHSGRASVVVGRLLRTGDISRSEGESLGCWLVDQGRGRESSTIFDLVGRAAHSILDTLYEAVDEGGCGVVQLLQRDDVESALWFLGQASLANIDSAATSERDLLARAAVLDTRLCRQDCDWSSVFKPIRVTHPWLDRVAGIDSSSWWLDLYSLHQVRAKLGRSATFSLSPRSALPPLRIFRTVSSRARSGMAAWGADVVGCEDAPVDSAFARETLLARLFSDRLELLTFEPGQGSSCLLALCVRWRGTGDDGIVSLLAKKAGEAFRPVAAQFARGSTEWSMRMEDLFEATAIRIRCRIGGKEQEEEVAIDIRSQHP